MKTLNLSGRERILITRTDRVGDLIISTPVFEAVKKKYPKSFLAVLVFKENEAIVRGNPWIDQVIVYDKSGKHQSWLSTFLFGLRLKKWKFDVVLHLHPTNRVNLISWLAGIKSRIGYQVILGRHGRNDFLLTHKIPEKKWQGKKHEMEYNFDLLKIIQVPLPEKARFYFPLHDEDFSELKKLFLGHLNNRYAVFHPSASCISKRWPIERMAEVADYLAAQHGILPVIIAEGEGVLHAQQMQNEMKSAAVNLAGQLTLGMLGWLLKGARLLVSNDSGPVHLAAAVGTPVISIFGRNQPGLSPARWRPLSENSSYLHKDVGCAVCLAHDCDIHFKCLSEISTTDVLDAVREYEPYFN